MSAATSFAYFGTELSLFEKARNWKHYWRNQIAHYIHGDVLEVGAGIGSNTRLLAGLSFDSWIAIEPDAALADRIDLPSARHRKQVATIKEIGGRFDTILYVDVLEHIEDDRAELLRARDRLKPGGWLIVLAPAHPFLFGPFDAAIGHHRRYTRASMRAIVPGSMKEVRLDYLDCGGLLASFANRVLLKSAHPAEWQVLFWDRVLVRTSRLMDRAFRGRVGKAVLGIWRLE